MKKKKLNIQQDMAVKATKTPVLVLAGPGTGKTTVISERIRYLLEQHTGNIIQSLECSITPNQIMCLTFSNEAANEIKKRIGINLMWSGTFHSVCFKMLQIYFDEFKNTTIIDEMDQKKISFQLGIEKQMHNINLIKDKANIKITSDLLKDYNIYQNFLKENNYMDFGEILLTTYNKLTEEIDICNHIKNNIYEIIVDEYQDTSIIQKEIVKLLSNSNVFCVGDPNQSIYKWRGASIENILKFEDDFSTLSKPCTVFRLEQNYRSTQEILHSVNTLISNNPDRSNNKIWSEKTGEKITICHTNNEGRYIAETIKNNKLTNIGILVRSTNMIPNIVDNLSKLGIQHVVQNRTKFFEKIEIKIAICYIKSIFKNDKIALEYIINIPKRGVGEKTFKKIEDALNSNQNIIDILILLKQNDLANLFIKWTAQINELLKPGDIMMQILHESKAFEYINGLEKNNDRINNLNILHDAMNNFNSIDNFLANFFLLENDNKLENCSITTIHASKGLEYDTVFVVGMIEGTFPDFRAIQNNGANLSEERRLAYVAFTRAKERLYLTYNLFDKASYRNVKANSFGRSRFSMELPKSMINDITKYYKD
jgi:DNA helicase-2/ATP-dependent DNA helicase PcrA